MTSNTTPRRYDIDGMLDDYRKRISALERKIRTYQPLIPDSGPVAIPAATGFGSALVARRIGDTVQFQGTLSTDTNWGAANSLQMPVAVGGIPADLRPDVSLIWIGASGATSAANLFRVAIQSNGGIQVRCNTATHTNTCSVNFSFTKA